MLFANVFHKKRVFFMNSKKNPYLLEPTHIFSERRLPVQATPIGYAALIAVHELKVPLPRTLSAIGEKHKTIKQDGWNIYSPRHAPEPTLEGHLTFALKQEGIDLAVMKRLFEVVSQADIKVVITAKPKGSYARRIWFLYEWLMDKELDLPDLKRLTYVNVLNPKQQFAVKGTPSKRHLVRNNLPGTKSFCPLVFRTKALDDFMAMNLSVRAQDIVNLVPKDMLVRTAAFLLLKDSRSSFAIEGEKTGTDRIQRWGRAIGEAGQHPLDLDELLRLQKIVIGDQRFVRLGLRREGGFIGEHDRISRMPIPDHIDARHEDLTSLIEGMIAFEQMHSEELDPIIAATILAFGFVYIHPFEDGNGRIHRYLIHHTLARRGFNPPGIIFPISAAIAEILTEYKSVLETYSSRLLPLIEWEPTDKGNVKVLNDTRDFYRYFDATPHAEFLYKCVQKTIEIDLPEETNFLRAYDKFSSQVELIVDMPNNTIDLLFNFLHNNDGTLSKRARKKEFKALTDDEAQQIEDIYANAFQLLSETGS